MWSGHWRAWPACKEIDLPTDRRKWIVHVSHENLLPARSMGPLQRLRFRLFMFLRLVSRPAYLLLRSGRRGATVRRDTAGQGEVISTHPQPSCAPIRSDARAADDVQHRHPSGFSLGESGTHRVPSKIVRISGASTKGNRKCQILGSLFVCTR